LLAGNRTSDDQINELSESAQGIVVTKDDDFVNSHLVSGRTLKLLLVSTGNISNTELERLLKPVIPDLLSEFQTCSFIEFGRSGLLIRG